MVAVWVLSDYNTRVITILFWSRAVQNEGWTSGDCQQGRRGANRMAGQGAQAGALVPVAPGLGSKEGDMRKAMLPSWTLKAQVGSHSSAVSISRGVGGLLMSRGALCTRHDCSINGLA